MGGLLKPLTPIEADTLPDTVQYDFMDDEIRGILLEAAPVKDSADIFDAVSRYVAAELGKSLQDFVALLKTPEEAENEQVKPFAEVALKILKCLGGEYAAFAEELQEKPQVVTKSSQQEIANPPGISSLQTFDFKTAAVSFEEESQEAPKTTTDISLQPFNYEVATVEIQQKRTGLLRRKTEEVIINRRRQQNQFFIEDLGSGTKLDMVLIRGGSFTMGAPKNEEDSQDRERPQHQVTVPSFFMGKYQVTQAQWKAVTKLPQVEKELKENPSRFKGDNRPIENVS
ncbi:MAG: formylglycine-generating enzyme family protein, partial [Cyanobacteria bacterium J06636_27]